MGELTWRKPKSVIVGQSVLVRTNHGLVDANVEKLYFWTPQQIDIRWKNGAVQTVARGSIVAAWNSHGTKFRR